MWTAFQLIRVVGAGVETAVAAPARPLAPLRIDPNRAPLGELALLPGVGPRRAEAIVLHRIRHGPFRAADELAAVPGIGPGTVAALRSWLSIDTRPRPPR